jgi:hypothetical protein
MALHETKDDYGLKIEFTEVRKSPLAPLCQRGVQNLLLAKGGQEEFYK